MFEILSSLTSNGNTQFLNTWN